ncbi:MAG TPA: hypothetical protein VF774_26795 [Pseudoduganella sp.]
MENGIAGRIEPSLQDVGTRNLGAGAGDVPVAARCGDAAPPPGATIVVFNADGQARRPAAFGGKAVVTGKGEAAWWFGTGPHAVALVPFPAAPELGLQLAFVIDSADPRLARQRFDLFLFSEVAGQSDRLVLADLAGRIEGALRGALEQGTLDLPPCTSLDEWNAFRAGLDRLLYMRFGITVDDCVPVELEDVDFAAMLRQRAAPMVPSVPLVPSLPSIPSAPAAPVPLAAPVLPPGPGDAAALRRLFLELPDATRTLRLLPAPAFAVRQAQLQRLSLAALDVNTMPSLAWSAPGQARGHGGQACLGAASAAAVRALDELWALLARMAPAGKGGDEANDDRNEGGSNDGELDRIVANLAFHLAARRGVGADARREPVP